jgi:hypothetical protein
MKKRSTGKSDEYRDLKRRQTTLSNGSKKKAAGRRKACSKFKPEISLLRDEISRLAKGQHRLQRALESEHSESVRLISRCSEIESHYARLVRFRVATERLLDAQSREDLFEIIHEIVANLVGCDEFGIFRIDEQCALSLVSSCGIDNEKLRRIPLGSSLVGAIALKGEPYFDGEPLPGVRLPQESDLTACIPLKRHERLFGAIGIFRLLPHKAALEADDRDLLRLVGKLAAVVLLCASAFCHTVAIGAEA